jgi:hypothetical protein
VDPEVAELVKYGKSQGYNEQEIAEILKKNGYDYSPVQVSSILRSAAQGLTFNFADELAGMIGGEDAKEDFRAKDKAFKRDHPWIAGGSELAGGMALPLGAIGTVGKGAINIGRAALKGAGIGAAMGGAAGAGAAEGGIMERLNAALPAAGAGAALGAVIPGGIAAVRAGFSPSARAMSRLRGAVEGSGGPEAISRRAQEFADAGRGGEATLADMSRRLQSQTDFAANNSDEAMEVLENAFEPRAGEVNTRVADDVQRTLGSPHAEGISDDLAAARSAWADSPAGFEGLRQRNPTVLPVMGDRFEAILDQPRVRDAVAQAREIGLIGPLPKAKGASFEVLQGVKERMDTAVGRAFSTPGARDLAVRLRAARDEMVELMGEGVPGYRDVAQQYHQMYRLEEMLDAGRAAYRNTDARGLRGFLGDLSEGERDRFRQGLVSEMIADLRKASQGTPAVRGVVRPGANKRDIMEAAFGSRAELERFLRRQTTETTMARTGRALAGSQTHRRDAALVDPAGLAIDAATGGFMGSLSGALRSLSPKMLASRTAREMAPALATQGTPAIQRLMQQWQTRPPQLINRWAAQGAPAAGGLLGEDMMNGGGY